jgi:hypothetical protein
VRLDTNTSFQNGFDYTYNNGRQAGTYTRPDTTTQTWVRGVFTF